MLKPYTDKACPLVHRPAWELARSMSAEHYRVKAQHNAAHGPLPQDQLSPCCHVRSAPPIMSSMQAVVPRAGVWLRMRVACPNALSSSTRAPRQVLATCSSASSGRTCWRRHAQLSCRRPSRSAPLQPPSHFWTSATCGRVKQFWRSASSALTSRCALVLRACLFCELGRRLCECSVPACQRRGFARCDPPSVILKSSQIYQWYQSAFNIDNLPAYDQQARSRQYHAESRFRAHRFVSGPGHGPAHRSVSRPHVALYAQPE